MKIKFLVFCIGLSFLVSFNFVQVQAATTTLDSEVLAQTLRQQIAELLEQISNLQTEILQLQGQVEKTEQQIEKFTKSLRRGIKDRDVERLQEFLAQYPDIYPEGLVTGYFGPLTERAVQRFQKKNGIDTVGVVGPQTRAKINEILTVGAGVSGVIPSGLTITTTTISEKKIAICHYPPDNPENQHTLIIDESAFEEHIAHGDTIGACEEELELELEPDITLFNDVTNFTATVGNTKTVLSWTNPTNDNFVGTKILRRTNRHPINVIDGAQIYVGAGTSYIDTGLVNGITYYYKAFTFDGASDYSSGVEATVTVDEIEKQEQALLALHLAEKIGEDDAVAVAASFTRGGFVLTEEFIDEFIIDHSPGYDVDNDITIIGDPEAPYFLKIAENSLNRLYNYSPDIYQYAIGALRYVRGLNFGTRCGGARTGGPWMEVNTYIWIYDYKDDPLEKKPLIYSFLFVHEATHVKNRELEQSGQIRKLTGYENESIAYLAHAYYAKEYDFEGQGVLDPRFGMSLKEFVKRWTFRCKEEPKGYVWDWDFYVTVLEKGGFPPRELNKLRAYLEITSTAPVISNFQTSDFTHSSVRITWDTNKLAKTTKLEYSLNSDLSSATTLTNGYLRSYGTKHIYELVDLIQGKTYYYRITNTDISDNLSVSSINKVTTLEIHPEPTVSAEQSQFLSQWIYYGSNDKRLKSPRGIATDASGNIYVVDSANFRIQKLTSDGIFITEWGSEGAGDGQFNVSSGIAIDASGNVYVTDNANYNIQKFTSDGTFITKWGSQGSGDGQFYHLFGIAVDTNSNVYVSDQSNDRIQKFTSDGIFITKWGSDGYSSGQFRNPQGIATDASNNVYVIDQNNHRIQKFTSDGVFIAELGSKGRGDGQFIYPHGIAIDTSNNIYVADSYSYRIQKLTSDGVFIAKLGSRGYSRGQFDNPYDIAVDTSGNVYVVETSPNNRIQKFSPKKELTEKEQACVNSGGQVSTSYGSECVFSDEVLAVFEDLKQETGIDFSEAQPVNFKWVVKVDPKVEEETVSGKGFETKRISSEQYDSVESFLADRGFEKDLYNMADGTFVGLKGYKKDQIVCTVSGGSTPQEPDINDVTVKCGKLEITL